METKALESLLWPGVFDYLNIAANDDLKVGGVGYLTHSIYFQLVCTEMLHGVLHQGKIFEAIDSEHSRGSCISLVVGKLSEAIRDRCWYVHVFN
jgi:hypothetical protein